MAEAYASMIVSNEGQGPSIFSMALCQLAGEILGRVAAIEERMGIIADDGGDTAA